MKKQLLILLALCISSLGYAQTFTDNFITYTVTSNTNNTVSVNSYNPAGGTDVDIPTTVLNNSITYNVTSISDFAFVNNQLTSVVIPNSIINISMAAFAQNQLTSFTIPNSVVSIGSGVLSGNPLTCVISEATTPPTITTGGSNDSFATNGDRSNIDLSIPSGTASVYASAQWTGFNSVAEGLTGTFVLDHITYQINATPNNEVTVTAYDSAGGTIVDIPATINSGCTEFSVTNIGNSAFVGKQLTSIVIPNSVINIGTASFAQNDIITVDIPDSVLAIGWNAFTQNYTMTSLDLGNSVETIGENAFSDNFITSITIPSSVLTIADNAFQNSFALSNLVIENGVVSIGSNAFNTQSGTITNVIIPNSVNTIGDYAFNIPSLTDVFSESTTPPTITTGGNDTFGTNRSNIHLHIPAGTMGAYVTDAGALWTGFNPVSEDALSVSDFELANAIKVFNTTHELKIISTGSTKLKNYSIYSLTGAKIKEGTESTIAIDALSSSVYILKLDFNKGTVVKKFAK